MPLYQFRWSDQPEASVVHLEDERAVWSEAVASMGQALRDIDGGMRTPSVLTLEVFNEDEAVIATRKKPPAPLLRVALYIRPYNSPEIRLLVVA